MKMFLESVMALVALVFVMSGYEAKAQCPPGYTAVSFTRSVQVDQWIWCDVKFNLCVKTTTSGVTTTTNVLVQSFEFVNANCVAGINIDNQWFHKAFRDSIFLSGQIGTIPPCGPTPSTHIFVLSKAACAEAIMSLPPGDPSGKSIIVRPCTNDEIYCSKEYFVCVDYSYNPPQTVVTLNPSGPPPPIIPGCGYGSWSVPVSFPPAGRRVINCQIFCE